MSEQTGISWADRTFNGWIGCTKVSPACDNCYAAVSRPSSAQRGPVEIRSTTGCRSCSNCMPSVTASYACLRLMLRSSQKFEAAILRRVANS